MAFLLSLLRCLLLSCIFRGLELCQASHVDLQSGSDFTPELEELFSPSTLEHAALAQFKAELIEVLRTTVVQATAEAHGELSSRLREMQGSLKTLPQLTARLEVVEQAVADIRETSAAASACQESLRRLMSPVCGDHGNAQQDDDADPNNYQRKVQRRKRRAVTDVSNLIGLPGKFQNLQQKVNQDFATLCGHDYVVSDALTSFSKTQREVRKAVSDQNSRLDVLAESVTVLSSRLNLTQTQEKPTKEQEEAMQTLSSLSLDGVTDSLAAISARQLTDHRALSAQSGLLTVARSSLSVLSERQLALQRTLSEQSGQLAGVAEVVSRTPVPAGRPSLVTGRLLGEPCRSDTECSTLRADTVCGDDGRCQCAAGLQPVAGETCRPYPRLFEPCRATSDCRGATELAVCADSRCACPRGLFNFTNTECRTGLGIGEPCDRDSDCSTLVGLTCNAGACAVRTCDPPRGGSYQYRLMGGSSCSDGLIQFTFNAGRLWQNVCDSEWTHADAAVACRYMGFAGGVPLPWNNTAVNEANFFSVKDFVCEGSERSLSRCRRVYGRQGCAASEFAGVQCSDPGIYL